jgi:hypothetical protein
MNKLNELISFCLGWDSGMFHTKSGSENVDLIQIIFVSNLNWIVNNI